jgi:two-component system, chemotaxis family, protein-glutamate methylesterase/glutaminase
MRDIIVIGSSSGGVHALKELTASLPADLPASIFIVLHMLPTSASILPEILGQKSLLPVSFAKNNEPIRARRIYIAPPDYHLLVERDHMHVVSGPREHLSRPGINPLFRSAAQSHRGRVIGVILTGQLDDGVAGLWEIKRQGGVAVVQSPVEAQYPSMPLNAINNVAVDHTVKIPDMPALLSQLVLEDGKMKHITETDEEHEGDPVDITCPDCRGPLKQYRFGPITEFRCLVGHAHSALSLTHTHREAQERALWAALVALEEGAKLSKQLADSTDSQAYQREAEEKSKHAEVLKAFITDIKFSGPSD